MNKINGIDVSEWELKGVLIPITECKYFEGIGDCKESKGLCVDNDNCYFKQFKRLQEENKRLQMLSCANCGEKYLSPDGAELYEKNVQLQEENEKLKNINNDLIEEIASGNIDIAILQKENEELKQQLEFSRTHKTVLDVERIKYKQALENIKLYINQECENKQCPQTCANCFMGNVLIKVNEVLNGRD